MRYAPAYIGVGSNLDGPEQQVRRALTALAGLDGVAWCRCSPLYLSRPQGRTDQPDFVNAAAAVLTTGSARVLLDQLLGLERAAGRVRRDGERWGPRVLDLDLLVYAGVSHDEPRLTLPHPRMHERNFVLLPLAELAPALIVPGKGTVATLLHRVGDRGIRRLD